MSDAALLAMVDAQGGSLWRPARLDDFLSLPDRTFRLYTFYRSGQAARMRPWDWWRPKDTRTHSHQWRETFDGHPKGEARCGHDPGEVAEWERSDIGQCPKCQRLSGGQHTGPRGVIDGITVGPPME